MSSNDLDEAWVRILEETHLAVCRFASVELDKLTRRVVHMMQRMPASGTYGDYPFKSIWDEYCHEQQNGPTEQLEYAWDQIIRPAISWPIGLLPDEVATLISIGVDREPRGVKNRPVSIDTDLIFHSVKHRLDRQAMDRSLDRFLQR
jgi:hypothetical protein